MSAGHLKCPIHNRGTKDRKIETGEIYHGIKCLSCKHENLVPQHPSQNLGVATHTCNSNTRKAETEGSLELAGLAELTGASS